MFRREREREREEKKVALGREDFLYSKRSLSLYSNQTRHSKP
jgi:hypothetical protein